MNETLTKPDAQTEERTETDQPWLWNVVLLDDDEHTYEYVIRMAHAVFAMPIEKAFKVAQTVDADGRGLHDVWARTAIVRAAALRPAP